VNAQDAPVLLVVDDEPIMLKSIRRIAQSEGYRVFAVSTAEEGLETLDAHDVDVALIDYNLPRMSGLELIDRARKDHPATDYQLFTGEGDADLGFRALRSGADGFITKPINAQYLLAELRRGVQAKRLRAENQDLRRAEEKSPADRLLLGPSAEMAKVRHQIRSVASMPVHVMILGESGVGKEVCARALNAESGRKGTYVVKNCGAIAKNLVDLELFGAEPGAYTGMADSRKPHLGAFEIAQDGIVFLDEVGDLPLDMQVKLLRVLENRTFQRMGSAMEREFRGRIIAATNKDLQAMVEEGTFRQDLLHRFALTIRMPPLREHKDDIELLTWQFLSQLCQENQRVIESVEPEAMHCLKAHDWRENNVRELRNALFRALIQTRGTVIRVEHLPDEVQQAGGQQRLERRLQAPAGPAPVSAPPRPAGQSLPHSLLELSHAEAKEEATCAFERWYLTTWLERHDGNVTQAAQACGLKRPNFYRLMKRYGVQWPPPEA